MADFSSTEKTNATWKHLFGILGTSNSVPGKFWYEETIPASHIVVPNDIWSSSIPSATTLAQAKLNAGAIVEDRSDGISVTLVANGSNWDISSPTAVPVIGMQVTNTHPSPTWIKSITTVVDNGGGSYTITLNNNSGVSAGSAVLQRRVFLTVDPTTNGLAWFARSVYGSTFSSIIQDFIQPQLFGKGYTIRLFKADGTEILTTQGAWIFNSQKGIMLFAQGQTPANLGYAMPVYIEGFRYTGSFGAGTSLPSGTLHDTLRFDGSNYVPNSSLKADGNDVFVENELVVSGSVVLPSGITPVTSGSIGSEGEFRWSNQFLYVKTALGWARTNLNYF